MLKLSEIARRMERGVVVVRGVDVSVRVITHAEQGKIRQAFPRPEPPRNRKDPEKGSLAPQIANPDDPDYKRTLLRWDDLIDAVEVAVACEVENEGGAGYDRDFGIDEFRDWAIAAAADVSTTMSLRHIRAVLIREADLAVGKSIDPEALDAGKAGAPAGPTTG